MLRYLQMALQSSNGVHQKNSVEAHGQYADYWNQFTGVFADEEWERPPQGELEHRTKEFSKITDLQIADWTT